PLPRSRGPVGWEGEVMGVAEVGRTSRDGNSEPQGGTTGAASGTGAERRARGQVVEAVAGAGHASANASPLVRGGRAGEGPSEASGRGERMGRRSGASGVPEPSIVALSGFSAVRTPITQRWNLGGAWLGGGALAVLGSAVAPWERWSDARYGEHHAHLRGARRNHPGGPAGDRRHQVEQGKRPDRRLRRRDGLRDRRADHPSPASRGGPGSLRLPAARSEGGDAGGHHRVPA